MQVAIDARYIREKPSGIGTYVQALVDRLPSFAPSDGFLFWAHPLAERPLSGSPNARDVVVTPGPNSPLPVWWPGWYAPLDDVDVFHSPHNLMPRGIRCPSVVTVHDVMSIERPDLHLQGLERIVKRAYYQQAVWRALRQATCLIAPTRDVADRVCRLEPSARTRVHVILEAADPYFTPAADRRAARRRATELTGDPAPFLLVVGANSLTKRHGDAIAGLAHVPAPWRLVLLQRQGTDRRLEALARRVGVDGRVTWIPRVSRADVVALMQAADGLVQPSLYEGFGLPVIEAMACGCPVIVSDIPVFREVTGGAAVFAEAARPDNLGDAMKRLVTSAALREDLSASGLARARELSWERCAGDTLDVYRAAAAAATGTARRLRERTA